MVQGPHDQAEKSLNCENIMNERIKELAFEAGQGGHSWYNDPNCLQKFAELIIKECAEVGAWNGDSAVTGIIKEHFGVKE